MADIRKTYVIDAPPEVVWRALTDSAAMDEWGSGPAQMDARVGGAFSQWNGDMHGTVTGLVPGERLVQDWFGGDWPDPSVVVFTLGEHGEGTLLELTQTGVPEAEVADFDFGWDAYYLGAIKEWAER
jgi:uncharacterized protein YndB with AHSA1/START domain